MKWITGFLLLATFSAAAADFKIPSELEYESGRTLCEVKHKDLLSHEKGFYISVPVDYRNPQKGTTDLYAYFKNEFKPEQDTVVYFTGGPGQTVHWGLFDVTIDFNLLLVEQRGIGCSRPTTRTQYLNPEFYSSENVARDVEKIREHLKLKQISLFGISYGTVPATIYASLFPKTTKALILEGTVFQGGDLLWAAPHRRKLLHKLLNELPKDVTEILASVSRDHGIPDHWFADLARMQMMTNGGFAEFRQKLLTLREKESYTRLIEEMKNTYQEVTYEKHPLFIQNDIPYYMITCTEMGLGLPGQTTTDSLVDGRRLVAKPDLESAGICQQLKAVPRVGYEAKNYPVRVPVTYFQGTTDSATVAPGAVFHYKNVAKARKQLLFLKGGGHNPNLQNISREYDGQLDVFKAAIRGELVSQALIERVNQSSDFKWVYTSKE